MIGRMLGAYFGVPGGDEEKLVAQRREGEDRVVWVALGSGAQAESIGGDYLVEGVQHR